MIYLLRIIFIAIALINLTACSPVNSLRPFDEKEAAKVLQQNYTAKPAQQIMVIKLPKRSNLKKLDLSADAKGAPAVLVPSNETENFSESIRTFILGYKDIPDATPRIAIAKRLENIKSLCALNNVSFIIENLQFALYEATYCCEDKKNQFEFGKAIRGHDAIYIVYYVADVNRVSPIEIARMKEVIRTAELVMR